jgi:hypothetical protein
MKQNFFLPRKIEKRSSLLTVSYHYTHTSIIIILWTF